MQHDQRNVGIPTPTEIDSRRDENTKHICLKTKVEISKICLSEAPFRKVIRVHFSKSPLVKAVGVT